MKNYFSIFKLSGTISEKTEQIRFILINLFVFFLPFDKFYTTLILLLLALLTLMDFNWAKVKQIPKSFWIFQLTFFLSVLGYFYSQNKAEASSLIERQLAIFIFPILLPLAISVTKERISTLLTTLSISSVLTTIGLFAYVFYTLLKLDLPLNLLLSEGFFNHNFASPIGIHAGYLSVFLSLSMLFLITKLSFRKIGVDIVIGLSVLILLLGLLFLVARSILIYTVLIMIFVYPWFYVKNRWRYFIVLGIIIAGSFLFISKNQFLKDRFSKNLIEDVNFKSSYANSEILEPRSERWKMGVELSLKKMFVGHGAGDERDRLQEKYKENGYIISYMERYNAHNQYLSILIKHGIFGLCLFLGSFLYFYKVAIQSKNFIYIAFLFGITFFFLTENVLDSNKGIFYFAFFNVILGYSSNSKRLD